MNIKAGIIGASGYTGYELIKILSGHKNVELAFLNSRTHGGKTVKSLYQDFFDGELKFTNIGIGDMDNADVVFKALPSGESIKIVPKLKKKVIDLSADYRFNDLELYQKIYNKKHDKRLNAAYGLPELFRGKIRDANLIANPGCYATSCILAALPMQEFAEYIVFDCKSGYSGAGVRKTYVNQPENFTDNVIPYNISKHMHKYEINQFINTKISFTPHVLPTFRGLMCTMHALLKEGSNADELKKIYKNFYQNEPFVKVTDKIPELHDVQNTNCCCIGGFEIDENNQLVVVSVIDNLLKGASGQAVQNMNIMFGMDEREGLG